MADSRHEECWTKEPRPSPGNTAAIVVLYHADPDLVGRLAALKGQVSRLYAIVNDLVSGELLANFAEVPLSLISQPSNPGLGFSLNVGMARARDERFCWCLLLDQDSRINDELVETLAELSSITEHHRAAVLAPNYRCPVTGVAAYEASGSYLEIPVAITSGSLVSIQAWQKIGKFRSDFFIEALDTEFSLRARKAGYCLFASRQVLMTHAGGNLRRVTRRGKSLWISEHAPWRYYLQYRNTTWTVLRYAFFDPAWAARMVVGMIRKIISMMRYEDQRLSKVSAMLKGTIHGVLGYMPARIADNVRS